MPRRLHGSGINTMWVIKAPNKHLIPVASPQQGFFYTIFLKKPKILYLPRIISPVQERLALLFTAVEIVGEAILFQLSKVAFHRPPSLDLSLIVRASPTHKVSTIPLEPASRIFLIDPTSLSPLTERQRGVDTEIIKFRTISLGAELGLIKPVGGEFISAVGHIFSTKNSELKHLLRRQLRLEQGRKTPTDRLSQNIFISSLH